MGLWDTIRRWGERDTRKLAYRYLPEDRTSVQQPLKEIKPRKHSFRLWLTEMHLKRDREWCKSW